MLILSLAGGALAVDKLMLGGGAPAAAQAAEAQAADAATGDTPAPAAKTTGATAGQRAAAGAGPAAATASLALCAKLDHLSLPAAEGSRAFSDAFRAPEGWFPVAAVPAAPVAAEAPRPEMKLTMVSGRFARINDQLLAVGDTSKDGVTLVSVDTRLGVAEVEVNGQREVLEVAPRGDAKARGEPRAK